MPGCQRRSPDGDIGNRLRWRRVFGSWFVCLCIVS